MPSPTIPERSEIVRTLADAGCVDPEGEADELLRASRLGMGTSEDLVARRVRGEPLSWITGSIGFLGLRILVDRGVFEPRPHTEILARRAIELLPARGVAVDLCTGSGAVAAAMHAAHPQATIHATDVDAAAVACARRNGVAAEVGDLDEPLPSSLDGRVDVLTAVVPYVPTEELRLLPRDVLKHEPPHALDGGTRGIAVLARAAQAAARLLRPGATALLEIGGDQAPELERTFATLGMEAIRIHRDEDGLDRVIEARRRQIRQGPSFNS